MMRWSNLLKAFQMITGARLLLLAWEALLGAILWASGFLLPWWGFAAGYAIAFLLHELLLHGVCRAHRATPGS